MGPPEGAAETAQRITITQHAQDAVMPTTNLPLAPLNGEVLAASVPATEVLH